MPPRYAVLFVWMGVIGIGSLLFHATLKYSMQLLDEVPMLFSNSQMLYCLYAAGEWRACVTDSSSCRWHPSVGLRWLDCVPSWYRRSPLGHYAVAILITAIYVISPTPILFQICYGVMTLLVAVTLHLYANHLEAQHGPSISTVRRLLKRAAVFLIVAFAIWNVDNVWCDQLRSWRNERLPALLRPLLQLHAWWHVLTMISGTHSLVAVVVAWCRTDGRRVKLRWQMRAHCGGILPWIHFDLTASGEKSRIASHK